MSSLNWEKANRQTQVIEHGAERERPILWARVVLQHKGCCGTCGVWMKVGTVAWWHKVDGVRCMKHGPRGKGKALRQRGPIIPKAGADGIVHLPDDPALRRRRARRKKT